MKRRVPIKRKTRLKRGAPPNKKSAKQAGGLKKYSKIRRAHLGAHPICEAALAGCNIEATDIHHKAGRGKYLLAAELFLSVCRPCHRWIEEHPKQAKVLGFSVNRNMDYLIVK